MLILILSLKYLIDINYVNKSESLMSFQETLVSKKQKKHKKILKMQKNPNNLKKKTKIATSASLSQQLWNWNLSQEYFKVKTVNSSTFSFFLIAIHMNANSLRAWSNEHDISMKNYEKKKKKRQ